MAVHVGYVLAVLLLQNLGFAALPPTVQSLVDQFNPGNYSNILANHLYTRQGMNRLAVIGSHHDLCRTSISNQFVTAGLMPQMDYFTFQDSNNVTRTACNVIAVKPGLQNPSNEVYVVGSHYDSKNNPGADDNATGVAGILEMARIFSKYSFAKTVVFVAFDGEEIWDFYGFHRLGSVHYVDQHRAENIRGMISFDMIGWQSSSTPNTAWIYGRASSSVLSDDLAAAIQNYGGLSPVIRSNNSAEISDHVAFADGGFPACLLIEAAFSPGNPFYHTSGDYMEQPNYLDWNYAGKMCQSVIGYLGEKLQPVDITPRVLAISPGPGGSVLLHFSGLPGCQYCVESTASLASPAWAPISTNTATPGGLFEVVDTTASARPQGFYRARFFAGASAPPKLVPDIIIDNREATVVGTWSAGTSSLDKYLPNYRHVGPGTGSRYLEFRPNFAASGQYDVFEWHPEGTNRTTDAPVQIVHSGGTQTLRLSQRTNGGRWVLLGRFPFAAGSGGYVRISDNYSSATGSVVIADAIKFVYAQ